MEYFEIGSHFDSYDELKMRLDQLHEETNTRYWKRDARTINACRAMGVSKAIKESLVYYEIKFLCIYAGITATSRGVIRHKTPRVKTDCPAFFRFRVSEDGLSLLLVSMNTKHNHKLEPPAKKPRALKKNVVEQEKRRASSEEDSKSEIIFVYNENDNSDLDDHLRLKIEEEIVEGNKFQKFTFRGLIAPVITPFNYDLERSLNLNIIPKYAQYLKDSGINGVLVNGTSGEGPSMKISERKQVTEAWVDAVSVTKQHLMVQIGGAPLPDVIELAKHAEKNKVDSLLCLPELFFKPKTPADLIAYLSVIGKAAPNTPLLYYHVPMFTDVNINMGEFLNEVAGKIPTFSGIKFTSTLLDEGLAAVNANKGQYAVFLGADQVLAGAFVLGFDSAIATTLNMFANLGLGIKQNVEKSDFANARVSQTKLNKIIDVVTKNGSWVTTMKAAMRLVAKIDCGPPRLPLDQLTDEDVKQMEKELKPLL